MPRTQEKNEKPILTREERRAMRELRREKQREDNIGRAAKMHAARLRTETQSSKCSTELKPSVHVGCFGWRYWTGNGEIRFMPPCHSKIGSSTT